MFFVSVASKGFSVSVSALESTLAGGRVGVDSKGGCVAPKQCKMGRKLSPLDTAQLQMRGSLPVHPGSVELLPP